MRYVAAPLLALSALLLLSLAWGASARADDVRPVSLDVRETTPGRYEVRFSTPMRGGSRLRARPRLPEAAAIVVETWDRQVIGDSFIERFAFDLEGGLVGHELGVDGLVLGSRNAILRVRLRDGRDLRAVLGGARPVFLVEAPPAESRPPWTHAPMQAARRGLWHGALEPAHLLLALGLVLAAKGGVWILGLGLFLVLDLLGASFGFVVPSGWRPSPELADAFVALAACLVAREALLGRHRRLVLLAALAGLAHGLSAAGLGSPPLELLGYAFGLDLAHLVWGGALFLGLASLRNAPVRRTLAWGVGVLAFAVAGVAATRAGSAPVAALAPGLLPSALVADAPSMPGTTPAPSLATDLEVYLDVGVFETRVEVLARLETLTRWLALHAPASDVLAIADQAPLLEAAAAAILARVSLEIDGEPAEPAAVRAGFAVQEPTGTYIRDEAIDEMVGEALVGVVYALRTPSIPKSAAVAFAELPVGLFEVRARVIDPEVSRELRVPADAPRLAWENTLREDPLPPVRTIRVRKHPVPLALLSLGLVLVGLVGSLRVGRRRSWVGAGAWLRVAVALAFLALPFLTIDVSASISATTAPAPTPREARAIASALLENLYRAFNVREEEAVYDRLALSLTETSRGDAYMENRRALAFARVGGARTHIDVVELVDLAELQPTDGGGFETVATWTVAGSVTHFGHRHLRQNRYVARLALVPVDGNWLIDVFDVQDIARTR